MTTAYVDEDDHINVEDRVQQHPSCRTECLRAYLPAPLQLATEADHKLGFGYSLDAEFAGRGCDAIGRGPLPPTDPTPRACRKETPLPQCRFLESVKRWASGVATRVVGDRWGSRP